MAELIFLIVIINFIVKAVKKSNEEQKKNNRQAHVNYQMPRQNVRTTPAREQVKEQNDRIKQAARENIEKARRRAAEKNHQMEIEFDTAEGKAPTAKPYWEKAANASVAVTQQEEMSAMEQIHAGRMEASKTTILERAKKNAEEDKEDVTLHTMEAEHNHSERVSAAIHHHPEDNIPESMLGSVEDLMVKGYDGNLCFERDFVGEAMDMINRFTVPSDVPDFDNTDEVA